MSRDYADGDVIFDTQWIALKNAMNGNGVLDPAPTLTPGGAMLVAVGGANVMHNKILTAIVPGSVTFTVAAAKSKWGAIWIPASGTPYMKMGAEADRPIMPEPNSWDDVLLGGVLITLGMTVIGAADIIEMMFQTMLQSHMQNVANPHTVTYTQAGAEQAFGKNSAFNKNFGTGTANVPQIGSTLGNTKNVITDGTGKLITQNILLPSGTYLPPMRFDFPILDNRGSLANEPRFETNTTSFTRAGPDTNINFNTILPAVPGMTLYVRVGYIVYCDTPAYDTDMQLFAGTTGIISNHVGTAPTVKYSSWMTLSSAILGSLNYPMIRGNNALGTYYLTKCWLELAYVIN